MLGENTCAKVPDIVPTNYELDLHFNTLATAVTNRFNAKARIYFSYESHGTKIELHASEFVKKINTAHLVGMNIFGITEPICTFRQDQIQIAGGDLIFNTEPCKTKPLGTQNEYYIDIQYEFELPTTYSYEYKKYGKKVAHTLIVFQPDKKAPNTPIFPYVGGNFYVPLKTMLHYPQGHHVMTEYDVTTDKK